MADWVSETFGSGPWSQGASGAFGGNTASASGYMTDAYKKSAVPSQQQAGFTGVNDSLTSQRTAELARQEGGYTNVTGLQAQQQARQIGLDSDVSRTRGVASDMTAPGQDVFSQKLASMATGQFDSSDPSYAWRMAQGQQALERSAAAKGMLGSGNILAELTQYGQGMASTEYANQFQRMLAGSQNVTQQYGQAYNTLAQMLQGQDAGVGRGGQLAQIYQGQQAAGMGLMEATARQGQLGIAQGGLGLDQSRLQLAQNQFDWQKDQSLVGRNVGFTDLNAQDRLAAQSRGFDDALSLWKGGGGGSSFGGSNFAGNYSSPSSPFSFVHGSDYNSNDTGYGFSPGNSSYGQSINSGSLISGGLANSGWSNAGAPAPGISGGGE